MQYTGVALAISLSVLLSGFEDVDPNAAEYPTGLAARSIMLQSSDLLSGVFDDDRLVWPSEYGFRDGAHYCGEYRTRLPGAADWQRHWYLAQFEAFENSSQGETLLPMSLQNGDASSSQVAEWCPSLATSGEFTALMTPEIWALPAKHLLSVQGPLNDSLDTAFQAALAQSGLTPTRGGATRILPESSTRVCGQVPLRLRSSYATQSQIAFTARIAAEPVSPSGVDPFPSWDVSVEDVRLLNGWDEAVRWCPSVAVEQPAGYGAIGQSHTVSIEDAIEAHQDRHRVCHTWETVDPYFPSDISGGPCHLQAEQASMDHSTQSTSSGR